MNLAFSPDFFSMERKLERISFASHIAPPPSPVLKFKINRKRKEDQLARAVSKPSKRNGFSLPVPASLSFSGIDFPKFESSLHGVDLKFSETSFPEIQEPEMAFPVPNFQLPRLVPTPVQLPSPPCLKIQVLEMVQEYWDLVEFPRLKISPPYLEFSGVNWKKMQWTLQSFPLKSAPDDFQFSPPPKIGFDKKRLGSLKKLPKIQLSKPITLPDKPRLEISCLHRLFPAWNKFEKSLLGIRKQIRASRIMPACPVLEIPLPKICFSGKPEESTAFKSPDLLGFFEAKGYLPKAGIDPTKKNQPRRYPGQTMQVGRMVYQMGETTKVVCFTNYRGMEKKNPISVKVPILSQRTWPEMLALVDGNIDEATKMMAKQTHWVVSWIRPREYQSWLAKQERFEFKKFFPFLVEWTREGQKPDLEKTEPVKFSFPARKGKAWKKKGPTKKKKSRSRNDVPQIDWDGIRKRDEERKKAMAAGF